MRIDIKKCNLCSHKCGVDRTAGAGYCGIDDKVHIAHYGLHRGEEPFLTGNRGSGTIFFAGCSLRCRYCQNYQISRWKCTHGYRDVETVSINRLVAIFRELESMGAVNINFVSPTPYVFHIREAVIRARKNGFNLPIVYNTHGYDSPETVDSLDGLVDIYLPDMKYGNDDLGWKFSGAKHLYTKGKECIRLMYEQSGLLRLDANGLAYKGIAVRHLVIPGHVDNSLQVIDFLESVDRRIHLSLMSQFHPCEVNYDRDYPELNRTLKRDEYRKVADYAIVLGFKNLILQDMSSHVSYLPDFDRDGVFTD
jgi:putative pyruvate formate lyase activating enzyme